MLCTNPEQSVEYVFIKNSFKNVNLKIVLHDFISK